MVAKGKKEFDTEVQKLARGEILDVGCGSGEFALRVAQRARQVVGIDPSKEALKLAGRNLEESGLKNVTFRYGNVRQLPFSDECFDLVYSRRGPASEDKHNLEQVFRVLRTGGIFVEIAIGEKDKQNVARIFGRGQMLDFRGRVSDVKKQWLKEVGFRTATSTDYLGTEIFRSIDDLVIRLKSAPIIPSFDAEKDKHFLEMVEDQCTTERGLETPVHRVVLVATK